MQFRGIAACWMSLLVADTACAAPDGFIRAPVLGYIQLSGSELRPVTGFVGANVVADPISPGIQVRRIFPAPGQLHALLEVGEPAQIGVAPLDATGVGSFSPISNGLVESDRVTFSPSGKSAILYSGRLQRLQVITGLPERPRIARDIGTSRFADEVAGTAVSDDGDIVLAAFFHGHTALVARIGDDGTPQTVMTASSVSAIRFAGSAHTAAVADSRANQVLLLNVDSPSVGNPPARLLAGEAQGVSAPTDIETSTDGRFVFLANSGAPNILMIDSTTRQVHTLACGFVPSSFQRLMKSVIGVVAQDKQSVSVLDADAATPWVAFAPRVR